MTKAEIVKRAKKIRSEIEQIFVDVEHWNECVRRPGVKPIDPDPDGTLRRMADGIDKMLASESKGNN